MKELQFKESAAQKVYADYMKRIVRSTTDLPSSDIEEISMEINSHIYESMQQPSESEVDHLLNVLDKLGAPEEFLKPLVAEKKLVQATRTMNPKHVFRALALNISNGLSYVIFALLYLFLFVFLFLIGAKLINPDTVGLYFKGNSFQALGKISDSASQGLTEVLGNWFIPVMIIMTIVFYFLITLMLRFKRTKLRSFSATTKTESQ